MDLSKFKDILKNEPAFRARQASEAVFKLLIDDWPQAIAFPKVLRDKFAKACPLGIDAKLFVAKDKQSIKALITLADAKKIEAVLMRHDDRNTVCVSSQVGCPMGCVFCATGKLGFKRNLTSGEIVEQVVLFARLLKKEGKRVDNIVFMGMGEPFLNYDNVIKAIRIVNDKNGLNIGARHISISTVGIAGGIEKLIDEQLQVNLAISLHAPNDRLRAKIIPATKRYPIKEIISSVLRYVRNSNRRVMFEYIMIDGVNDSDECARELVALIKSHLSLKLVFVNLIRYNPTGNFVPSAQNRFKRFKEILERERIEVTERYRFGREIKAACGQLAGEVKRN
jgi:23S rRNA (adenine2503-C2)-methyltransferase